MTQTGEYLDANGDLQGYNAGLENDTMVLAYRVRITSVPEPPTWALLLAGSALVVGTGRHRHRT